MARDILSEYGPDYNAPQKPVASDGGRVGSVKNDHDYCPPVGPTRLTDVNGPGLHGGNAGNANKPTANDGVGGRPGNHGTNHGNCGSQGRY